MNISSSAALQANTTLLNSAQKQLLLANKYTIKANTTAPFICFVVQSKTATDYWIPFPDSTVAATTVKPVTASSPVIA